MNPYERKKAKEEKEERRKADRILLIIFGLFILISPLLFEDKLPNETEFTQIEGTLKEDIIIRTGVKSKNNYFTLLLKEDIYRKARFKANQIFFLVDRKKLKALFKKGAIVEFYVYKKDFSDNFLIQDNDIYGPKKLKKCILEPIALAVNNKIIFSLQNYFDYQRRERSTGKIFHPILSIMLILGGIYYDKLGELYYRRMGLFLILMILAAVIIIIYTRYFLHKQY